MKDFTFVPPVRLGRLGDEMVAIVATTVVALLLAIPVLWAIRSDRTLTWTTAVLLGTLVSTVGLLLVADVPSRILYWFDAEHETLGARLPGVLGEIMAGDNYVVIRDVVANTVQGIFAVIIIAAVYFWGERHRREGRFSK